MTALYSKVLTSRLGINLSDYRLLKQKSNKLAKIELLNAEGFMTEKQYKLLISNFDKELQDLSKTLCIKLYNFKGTLFANKNNFAAQIA